MSSTPTNLLLSLATGSMLMGLWCGRAIARTVETLGEASENLFRGDRLPILDFPDQSPAQTQTNPDVAPTPSSPES
ncbi:MAG: hypothetical protein HC795_10965 [Coleofasciculaceae cyanobacterium RL_1_1]|nr:hypothetical protein [Coleofasciculaceae cyanobacterium RL_1_1]